MIVSDGGECRVASGGFRGLSLTSEVQSEGSTCVSAKGGVAVSASISLCCVAPARGGARLDLFVGHGVR